LSCKHCEDNPQVAFVRWNNANVSIGGCPEHVAQVLAALKGVARLRLEYLVEGIRSESPQEIEAFLRMFSPDATE
jgi:hypothetical protein